MRAGVGQVHVPGTGRDDAVGLERRLIGLSLRARQAQDAAATSNVDTSDGRANLASSVVELALVVRELGSMTGVLLQERAAAAADAVPEASPVVSPVVPDAGSILAAWHRVAHLVGRDMASPESVVDAVAVLVAKERGR